MLKKNAIFAALLVLFGCAGARSTAAPSPSQPLGDPALYQIFAHVPLDTAARAALDQYEIAHLRDFLERVAMVAEDPGAGTEARYNAVMLLGERYAAGWIPSLRVAATARDERVRAAVVVAAARIMGKHDGDGRSLVVAALDDPSAQVQAKALEVLGTSDVPLLREFLKRHPRGEVAKVARDFIVLAEQRGSPFVADSSGVLHGLMPGQGTVTFTPGTRWPQWDAAVGTLQLANGSNAVIDSVEVVRNAVPLVFSPDGRFAAYERQRTIYVRDLRDGTVRSLGPGVAPRARPFSEDFLFFREIVSRRGDLQERTRLVYDIVSAPFAGGSEPAVLGTVGAFSSPGKSGNYSPVRWAQVVEWGTNYTIEADGLETFKLPDPFKAPSTGDR